MIRFGAILVPRRRSPTEAIGDALRLLLACGLLLSGGCGRETTDAIRLNRWSLRMTGASSARSVDLPVRLESPRDEGSPTTYTFETEVRLPRRSWGQTLWFVVPELLSRSSLQADGEPAIAVTGSQWDIAWTSGPHAFEVPPSATQDGRIVLVWAVRRDWLPSDWIDAVPELQPDGELGGRASFALICGFVAGSLGVGIACMLGFAALIAGVVRRDDRRDMYLAVACVSGGAFFAFQAGWAQLAWGARCVHLVAVGYSISTWVTPIFTERTFHVRMLPRWLVVLPLLTTACAVVTWNRPSLAFVTSAGISGLGASLSLYRHVTALRPGRPDSNAGTTTVWLGWVAWLVFSIPDQLYYFGLGELTGGIRTSSVGLFIWGCALQQVLMSSRVADIESKQAALEARVNDARRANEVLEVMKRDLERLASADADPMLRVLESTASRRKGPRLKTGAIVDERYEVLGTLGIGGMGSVYDVRRFADDERFALKIAHHLDGETLARLAREAWVAATVRSRQVIDIHDVGVAPEGYLFFVMERFPGVAASSSSNRYGDVAWVTKVLADTARGLADLHEAGIVHRDLKPPNILVADTPDGPVAKVADFGISRFEAAHEAALGTVASTESIPRAISEPPPRSALSGTGMPRVDAPMTDTNSTRDTPRSSVTNSFSTPSIEAGSRPTPSTSLTQVGAIAGTVAYMAPEVANGSTAVAREADIFGFGVIAYEMLVGSRPFRNSLDVEPLLVDGIHLAASIRIHDVELEPSLLRTLDACLAIDPSERPTAKEVVAAFENARSNRTS